MSGESIVRVGWLHARACNGRPAIPPKAVPLSDKALAGSADVPRVAYRSKGNHSLVVCPFRPMPREGCRRTTKQSPCSVRAAITARTARGVVLFSRMQCTLWMRGVRRTPASPSRTSIAPERRSRPPRLGSPTASRRSGGARRPRGSLPG